MEDGDKENGQKDGPENGHDIGAQASFKAFISYSHADARLVRKLHSQLEAYRLPKGLGEISAQNAFSHGLGKIFRDREYLSVSQDLSSTVKEALAQSEVLLVVCSPNAKGSHWVEREIQLFKTLNPDRPILAALVEGEPAEAFPLALTEGGVEPLAADLRKEGDGWKLGFLKLVAGIVGVRLDALVQRDSQRQTARVMAVTGVVGFFALCMMAMAFVAIQARNEAQFQQAQAEELVAFMMGDLRRKLESVGRLDALEETNAKALEYLEAQGDQSDSTSESLLLHAKIVESVGRELARRGDDKGALAQYVKASSITQDLMQRDASNPSHILAHAWSKTMVMTARQDLENAESLRSEADEVLDDLESIQNWGVSEPDWLRLEALANGNRCATATFLSEQESASEGNCRRAIKAGQAYAKIDQTGKARFDLAYNTFWYSQWLGNHGRVPEAEEQYQAALQQTQGLSSDLLPEDAWLLKQRMEILGAAVSWAEEEQSENLCEAIEIGSRLLEIEPEDQSVTNLISRYSNRIGGYDDQCV